MALFGPQMDPSRVNWTEGFSTKVFYNRRQGQEEPETSGPGPSLQSQYP